MLSERECFSGMGVSVVYTEEEVDDDVEREVEDEDEDDDEDDDELVLLPEEPMVAELRWIRISKKSMEGLVHGLYELDTSGIFKAAGKAHLYQSHRLSPIHKATALSQSHLRQLKRYNSTV